MDIEPMIAKQHAAWPNAIKGAESGNPYATLCQHCYGRHMPPRDDLCPTLNLSGQESKYGSAVRDHLTGGGE